MQYRVSVKIRTLQGDEWFGIFSGWPDVAEIIKAVRHDRRQALWRLRDIEYDPTREAFGLECGKWKRLRDVVGLATVPAYGDSSPFGFHSCEVLTNSDTRLGTVEVCRQRVFRTAKGTRG